MTKNKKYYVVPGFIYSKNDGDRHFISSRDLIRLYGVDPDECLIHGSSQCLRYYPNGLIVLSPQNGDYSIPKLAKYDNKVYALFEGNSYEHYRFIDLCYSLDEAKKLCHIEALEHTLSYNIKPPLELPPESDYLSGRYPILYRLSAGFNDFIVREWTIK